MIRYDDIPVIPIMSVKDLKEQQRELQAEKSRMEDQMKEFGTNHESYVLSFENVSATLKAVEQELEKWIK